MSTSLGYGNYNAGFITFKMNDWHGVTMQNNFTYSKALGTGAVIQATSQETLLILTTWTTSTVRKPSIASS